MNKWKEYGVETAGRGMVLLQTLEQEGLFILPYLHHETTTCSDFLATMCQHALDVFPEAKAVTFLKSVKQDDDVSADAFLRNVALMTDESLTGFVQSIVVLVSSTSQDIVEAAMEMLVRLAANCSAKGRLSLAQAALIPQVIVNLNPQLISLSDC
ncbi:hypothetical protein BLNAU_3317 [Blattamonas nauphoetae]|uniref:Uncharacterized protein n=1 Tax=Blattamonas nauphoetae TaxID=2049346 RepID=A0ABQ9YDW8_9EUKA|nr:hypothetical protein BLNAU_3317 [Blattamonas nauphoetae]